MDDITVAAPDPWREIVFVLRLHAGASGWWGRVYRIDEAEPTSIAESHELYALLDGHWQAIRMTLNPLQRQEPEQGKME
jgi:hypothetical protein